MKYIAMLKVDQPESWTSHRFGPTASFFKSPILDDKKEAKEWLRKEKSKYKNARVNSNKTDKKYILFTTIIAFDEKTSENVDKFFTNF